MPSPEPLLILDSKPIERLIAAGEIVVVAGGGGIPSRVATGYCVASKPCSTRI